MDDRPGTDAPTEERNSPGANESDSGFKSPQDGTARLALNLGERHRVPKA